MSYARILVVLSGAADDENTITVAAGLAKQHGSVLHVLVASPKVAPSVWAATGNGVYYAPEIWDALMEAEAELKRRSEAMARRLAASLGLQYGHGEGGSRVVMVEDAATLWIGVRRELPLTELGVAGQSCFREDGPFGGVLDSALMEGRAPLLVVRSSASVVDCPAAIAWDGSIEAGRAVRAAAPLLQHARGVLLLQDPERLDHAERDHCSPEELSAYLTLRGVGPVTSQLVMGARPGEGLKQVAADMGAGVLVAGAFGHPRLLESLFGGATRTLLADEHGPHLFIAH